MIFATYFLIMIGLACIAGETPLILTSKSKQSSSIHASTRIDKYEQLMLDPVATSTEDFVAYLRQEAMSHDAVSHRYLKLVSTGRFSHLDEVLLEFVDEYRHYGKRFTQYVGMLMEYDVNGQKCSKDHQVLLERDLRAEEGLLDPDEKEMLQKVGLNVGLLDGVPHRQLFQQMRENIHTLLRNRTGKTKEQTSSPGMQFADDIADILQRSSFPARVAGLGFGVESMVPTIYSYLVRALEDFTSLKPDDYAFLLLHIHVDEGHGATMKGIVQDLALTKKVRREMLVTTRAILQARVRLWNNLLHSAIYR